MVLAVTVAAAVAISGSAKAEEPPKRDNETHDFEYEATAEMKRSAHTETQKKSAEMISAYASLLAKWTLQDVYEKEYQIRHPQRGVLDWTDFLGVGPGTFLRTDDRRADDNFELRKSVVDDPLSDLEAQLNRIGVALSKTERESLRRAAEAAYFAGR